MTVASEITLSGRALIEASAGTGKTWTLTSILLRLLLEEKEGQSARLPREIVATTFTRKAAAEMQRRVQQRLAQFHLLLRGLAVLYVGGKLSLEDDSQLAVRMKDALLILESNAALPDINLPAIIGEERKWLQSAAADDINQHVLLNAIQENQLDGFIALFKTVEARLADVSDLFIGTLDSLCQRWLSEYSLETGSQNKVEIVDGTQHIATMIHNQIRKYCFEHRNDPELAMLTENIPSPDSLAGDIASKLTFSEALLDKVSRPVLAEIKDQRQDIANQMQKADSAEYLANIEKLAHGDMLQKRTNDAKCFVAISHFDKLWTELASNSAVSIETLDKAKSWCAVLDYECGSSKYKKGADEKFVNKIRLEPLNVLLKQAVVINDAILNFPNLIATAIRAELLHTLYQQTVDNLPQRLAEFGETTFSEQIAKINRALAQDKEHSLARDIVHRYPVMLVDESQDLNSEQAHLIESLYIQHPQENGFLLLVGDPKQAIYRFRGGDVFNYVRLKERFTAVYELTQNFRSSKPLITALNTLYQNAPNMGERIAYEEIEAASDAERNMVKADGTPISNAVHWYEVEKSDEESEEILTIVKSLTAKKSRYARIGKDGKPHCIRHQDIMILMPSKSKLAEMQTLLQQAGIATEFNAESNIFSGVLANAITYLLQAMLKPQDRGVINHLLSSVLFGQSRADIERLQNIAGGEHADTAEFTYQALIDVLLTASKVWQEGQLLSALQYISSTPLIGQTIWERLASYPSPDGERYLLDLRQTQQIIADHSHLLRPQTFMRWWMQALKQPPAGDWAKMMPLPGTDAVRLMTIHKAKGLQSPVVILGRLSNRRNVGTKPSFQTYRDGLNRLHISALPLDEAQTENGKEEDSEEQARLLYVGLTRAEDLLFVCHRQGKYVHPAIAALQADKVIGSAGHHFLPAEIGELERALTQTQIILNPETDDEKLSNIITEPYAKKRFMGWWKTSFSALAKGNLKESEAVDINLEDYAVSEALNPKFQESNPNQELAFRFPRGTNPGSFLHDVLERLDVNSDEKIWDKLIQDLFNRYQLHLNDYDEIGAQILSTEELAQMRAWISNILHSPLHSQTTLASIHPKARANEMGFNLHVDIEQALNVRALNQLFAHWDKPLSLKSGSRFYHYIRGEIDVFYEYQGKYYVLDYKTNYLGDSYEAYDENAMQAAMDEHHYWLQALIYQLAAHRFLKSRLIGYSPEQHLGMPEYYFVRGSDGRTQQGLLSVNIPTEILLSFDKILQGTAL